MPGVGQPGGNQPGQPLRNDSGTQGNRPEWQPARPPVNSPSTRPTVTQETPRTQEAPRNEVERPAPSRRVQIEDQSRQQTWSHPLAKPAPPVQEKTPQQSQQEERKQQRWEQKAQPQQQRGRQPEGRGKQEDKRPPDHDKHR